MGENGFPYLDAAKLVFIHRTDHISSKNFDAVQKFNRIIPPIDLLDHKAVSVFLQSAGIVVKVVSNFDDTALFLRSATGHLYLEL